MTDPLTYLTAALDAAQRDAERLRDDLWWLGQEQVIRVYGPGDGLIAGADQAVHDLLAACGPDVVLRRIAADRKTLAEHRADAEGRCGRCAHWDTIWDAGRVAHGGRPYPCTTVRNMAEGYGWTEETT